MLRSEKWTHHPEDGISSIRIDRLSAKLETRRVPSQLIEDLPAGFRPVTRSPGAGERDGALLFTLLGLCSVILAVYIAIVGFSAFTRDLPAVMTVGYAVLIPASPLLFWLALKLKRRKQAWLPDLSVCLRCVSTALMLAGVYAAVSGLVIFANGSGTQAVIALLFICLGPFSFLVASELKKSADETRARAEDANEEDASMVSIEEAQSMEWVRGLLAKSGRDRGASYIIFIKIVNKVVGGVVHQVARGGNIVQNQGISGSTLTMTLDKWSEHHSERMYRADDVGRSQHNVVP